MFQQVRLWLYLVMVIGGILFIWYGDRHDALAAMLFLAAGILLHLEVPPECGRLVWKEGSRNIWTFWVIIPAGAF